MIKCFFLDRDGVVNVDKGYVHKWEDFELCAGFVEAASIIQENGYKIFIITNQSGIARGKYTVQQFEKLTSLMITYLKANGVFIHSVKYCPHLDSGSVKKYGVECDCRKPRPGMIIELINEYDISLKDSFLVGDKPSDIEAGVSAGVGNLFKVGESCKVFEQYYPGHKSLLDIVKETFYL